MNYYIVIQLPRPSTPQPLTRLIGGGVWAGPGRIGGALYWLLALLLTHVAAALKRYPAKCGGTLMRCGVKGCGTFVAVPLIL